MSKYPGDDRIGAQRNPALDGLAPKLYVPREFEGNLRWGRMCPDQFFKIGEAGQTSDRPHNPGDDLLSPVRTTIGRTGLASVFGMGTGVSPCVKSPGSRESGLTA